MKVRNAVALVLAGHVLMLLQIIAVLRFQGDVAASNLIILVCALAALKTVAYGFTLRRLVLSVITGTGRFHAFLFLLSGLMFTTMASFAADFFIVFELDPTSLTAMNAADSDEVTMFNAWYFSVLNFSFFGVADIIPATVASRFLLALESLASFLTLILILSDFPTLRESVRRSTSQPWSSGDPPKPKS